MRNSIRRRKSIKMIDGPVVGVGTVIKRNDLARGKDPMISENIKSILKIARVTLKKDEKTDVNEEMTACVIVTNVRTETLVIETDRRNKAETGKSQKEDDRTIETIGAKSDRDSLETTKEKKVDKGEETEEGEKIEEKKKIHTLKKEDKSNW